MTRTALAAAFVICGVALARADTSPDGEQAFRAALAAGDLDALEAAGAARPVTRWSDDAWSEAAQLANRTGDFARARRDLEQVLDVETLQRAGGIAVDEQLARRTRLELARLGGVAGTTGEWNQVAAEHERLVAALRATAGDPRPLLRELEQLVTDHDAYPRASSLLISLALGWERDGNTARALDLLMRARTSAKTPLERLHAHAELVRMLTRTGDLDTAAREIDVLAPSATPGLVASLKADLDRAHRRRTWRWLALVVLVGLSVAALIALRRAAGSWRAAGKRLLHPPIEALFMIPIGVVIATIAYTGNPLVARAVRTIVLAGIVASWISGAILDGNPRPSRRRFVIQAALAMLAVGAATYLAVDSGHLINFVIETWRNGPQR